MIIFQNSQFWIVYEDSGSFITSLKNLKGLDLEFIECQSLTNGPFDKLMKGLTNLDKLERLTLNCERQEFFGKGCSNNKISSSNLRINGAIQSLFENLYQLKSLVSLKINFTNQLRVG